MSSSFSNSLRGGRSRKFKAEINVVPYIDVMMVLLVIFMVAAPLTNPNVINLPTAGKSTLPPAEYIEVVVKPDASFDISIKGKKDSTEQAETMSSRNALLKKLKEIHESNGALPVLIAGDKDIKYDEVIQIISEAKKIGIHRVGLATK